MMIVRTIINSRRENPPARNPRLFLRSLPAREGRAIESIGFLPIPIVCSVHSSVRGKRVHVKYIVPSPAMGVRVILNRTQSPLRLPGHRIHWNFSKVAYLGRQLSGRRRAGQTTALRRAACRSQGSGTDTNLRWGADSYTGDQGFEIRRIIFAAHLGANQIFVRVVLVPINGIPQFAQIAPQFSFSLTLDRYPSQ